MCFKDGLGGLPIPFPGGNCLKPLFSCHLCLEVPAPLGLGPRCFQISLVIEKFFFTYTQLYPETKPVFKSEEAGVFITCLTRLGKIGILAQYCLCSQRKKFVVLVSWENGCPGARKKSRVCCAKTAKDLVAHKPYRGTQAKGFASSCLISDNSDIRNTQTSAHGLSLSSAFKSGISGPPLACPPTPGRSQTSPAESLSWQLR